MIFLSAADDRFARLTSKSRQRDNALRGHCERGMPVDGVELDGDNGQALGDTAEVGGARERGAQRPLRCEPGLKVPAATGIPMLLGRSTHQ